MKHTALALLVLLALAQPVGADDPTVAPVQIEWRDGERVVFFDCWPGARVADQSLTVYVLFPGGLAGYGCTFEHLFEIEPLLPSTQEWRAKTEAAWVFHYLP